MIDPYGHMEPPGPPYVLIVFVALVVLVLVVLLIPVEAEAQYSPTLQDYGITSRFLEYFDLKYVASGAIVLPERLEGQAWTFDAPTTGEPAVSYVAQLVWSKTDSTGVVMHFRLAGVDAQGRQGPFTEWGETEGEGDE